MVPKTVLCLIKKNRYSTIYSSCVKKTVGCHEPKLSYHMYTKLTK